jgi:glycosyltransferase involved in cell wall biosynthesis
MAPASHRAGALSRYTFLDEEIRALAERGIHAYVLSAAPEADADDGYLHVRSLPTDELSERFGAARFFMRHLPHIPLANIADVLQTYRSIRIERFAATLIAREGISLIHSYFGWPRGFGGLLAKAQTGVPLVAGLRGSDVNVLPTYRYGFRLDPCFDRAFRRLLRAADCTVSVSEFLRGEALKLGADKATSHVVLKGVRLDVFTTDADRDEARGSIGAGSAPVILAVAGLTPIKGLHHVLDALAIVRASGRNFSFIVCGDGSRGELEAQADRLGLRDFVSFRGKVPRSDIGSYFAAADLLVHGALIEASGNVLLEALASGVPIVCTDAGGPAEYVKDGVAGFVVPVGDAASMADRITRLLDDEPLRREFGRRGRERAQRHFAYDRMIDDTLALYESALGCALTEKYAPRLRRTEVSHA